MDSAPPSPSTSSLVDASQPASSTSIADRLRAKHRQLTSPGSSLDSGEPHSVPLPPSIASSSSDIGTRIEEVNDALSEKTPGEDETTKSDMELLATLDSSIKMSTPERKPIPFTSSSIAPPSRPTFDFVPLTETPPLISPETSPPARRAATQTLVANVADFVPSSTNDSSRSRTPTLQEADVDLPLPAQSLSATATEFTRAQAPSPQLDAKALASKQLKEAVENAAQQRNISTTTKVRKSEPVPLWSAPPTTPVTLSRPPQSTEINKGHEPGLSHASLVPSFAFKLTLFPLDEDKAVTGSVHSPTESESASPHEVAFDNVEGLAVDRLHEMIANAESARGVTDRDDSTRRLSSLAGFAPKEIPLFQGRKKIDDKAAAVFSDALVTDKSKTTTNSQSTSSGSSASRITVKRAEAGSTNSAPGKPFESSSSKTETVPSRSRPVVPPGTSFYAKKEPSWVPPGHPGYDEYLAAVTRSSAPPPPSVAASTAAGIAMSSAFAPSTPFASPHPLQVFTATSFPSGSEYPAAYSPYPTHSPTPQPPSTSAFIDPAIAAYHLQYQQNPQIQLVAPPSQQTTPRPVIADAQWYDAARRQRADYEQRLRAAEEKIASLGGKLISTEEKLKNAENARELHKRETTTLRARTTETETQLRTQMSGVQTELARVKKERESWIGRAEEMKSQKDGNEALQDELRHLKDEAKKMEKNMNMALDYIGDLQDDWTKLQQSSTSTSEQVPKLRNDLAEARRVAEERQEELKTLKRNVDRLEADKRALQQEVQASKTASQAASSDITRLRDQLDEVEDARRRVKNKLGDAMAELEATRPCTAIETDASLQSREKELEFMLNDSGAIIDDLLRDLDALRVDKALLEKQVAALEQTVRDLTGSRK